jgi:hypothetical protein
MAVAYTNAQIQGTSSTGSYSTLYSTGASVTALISSLLVTNTSSTAALYRIAIMSTAGTPAAANWVVYDATVQANDTVSLTLGLTLKVNQYLRVSSSANTVTFSAYVSEFS